MSSSVSVKGTLEMIRNRRKPEPRRPTLDPEEWSKNKYVIDLRIVEARRNYLRIIDLKNRQAEYIEDEESSGSDLSSDSDSDSEFDFYSRETYFRGSDREYVRNTTKYHTLPSTPGNLLEDGWEKRTAAELLEQDLICAQKALEYYNQQHKTDYELVDPGRSYFILFDSACYHLNFLAQRKNNGTEAAVPELFFADLTATGDVIYDVHFCLNLKNSGYEIVCGCEKGCPKEVIHPAGFSEMHADKTRIRKTEDGL